MMKRSTAKMLKTWGLLVPLLGILVFLIGLGLTFIPGVSEGLDWRSVSESETSLLDTACPASVLVMLVGFLLALSGFLWCLLWWLVGAIRDLREPERSDEDE
jgi:hypothetical protein